MEGRTVSDHLQGIYVALAEIEGNNYALHRAMLEDDRTMGMLVAPGLHSKVEHIKYLLAEMEAAMFEAIGVAFMVYGTDSTHE